jgi:serine/threonine protein kinase
MGVVWRAVDTLIERTVAIKELRGPAGATEEERHSFVERALREARNAGRLNHPGVVAVHDVISQPGEYDVVYIVMEYVQAPSLAEILDKQGPLPAQRVAKLGLGVLDALDAAHAMGIVHRDIKPGNVLVAAGDKVKLTDFGIALAAEDSRLTKSGVIGTQAYLAPECFDTGDAGPAADLWALGATLYHAVAGRAPFDRDTATATLRAILFEEPPPPPGDPRLGEAISGLLTRSADQRLSSDAARQLLEPVASQPVSSTPDPAAAAAAPWEANATGLYKPPTPTPPPVIPAAFSGPTGPPDPTAPGGFGPPTFVPTGQGQTPIAPAAQGGPFTGGTEPFAPIPGGPVTGPPMHDPSMPSQPMPSQPMPGPSMAGPPGQGPPPPVPTFNAPWGGPPPPGRRSRTPLILSIVGVLVAVGAILAVVLLMGGSKSSDPAKAAADKFFKADVSKNLDEMKKLACGTILNTLTKAQSDEISFHTAYKLGKVTKQDDDTSSVAVTLTTKDNRTFNYSTTVQKDQGTWKVCDLDEGQSVPSGGGDSDTAAAQDVVRRLLEAGKNRDLSTAQSLTCEPLSGRLENFPTITSYNVGAGTVTGSSAEVQFTALGHSGTGTGSDETEDGVAELQKQSGSWKVCDIRDASSSSGDTNGPEPSDTGLSSPDFPTDTGSSFDGSPTGSFCVTPSGSTPICVPE